MENPNTANAKARKSSGKHTIIKCPEGDKHMNTANLARHMRRAHTEEVKGSEALPSTVPPINYN